MDHKCMAIVTLISLLLVVSCSDSPKQYDRRAPNLPTDKELATQIFSPFEIGPLLTAGTDEDNQDGLVRENSSKDILYNGGVAGITMDMNFSEASEVLSIPEVVAKNSDSNEWAVYKEGLQILWRTTPPQVPELVIIFKAYQGIFRTGVDGIGDLKLGDDLNRFFTESDPDGKSLMRKIYNRFESKDESFDCYEENLCETKRFKDAPYTLLISPKIMLMISNDRKALSEIRFVRSKSEEESKNIFDTTFDLITGTFISEDKKVFGMDDSFEDLSTKQAGVVGLPFVGQKEINVLYGEVYATFARSTFGRDQLAPLAKDVATGFYLKGKFASQIQLSGVSESALALLIPNTKLQMNLGIQQESDQLDFIEKFNDLLVERITDLNSGTDRVVSVRVSGKHHLASDTQFESKVLWFSPTKGEGDFIQYNIGKIQGNIDYIARTKIGSTEMNKLVFRNLISDVDFISMNTSGKKLFGVKLGSIVKLREIDKLKGSAVGELIQGDKSYTDLVSYTEYVDMPIYKEGGSKISKLTTSVINISDIGVNLHLVLVRESSEVKEFKVVGIEGSLLKGVTNLCGLAEFSVAATDGAKETFEKMLHEIDREKIKKKDFSCNYLPSWSAKGDDQLDSIHFAKDGAALFFADGELSSLLIYSKEGV